MTKRENAIPVMSKYNSLDDIFADDDFHLIEEQKKVNSSRTADERLFDSFKEIEAFIEKTGREPGPNTANVTEYSLYSRLKGIRNDLGKIEQLKSYDNLDLLPDIEIEHAEDPAHQEKKYKTKPQSLDEILNDDSFDLISGDDEGLFDFKHVPKETERESADFVARRKPCRDFEKFEHFFEMVQKDLASGKRKLVDFKQGNLREGSYYVHNGILFYLAEINITQKEHYREDGTRVREDGRTRCIFENGTESNMLKRSVEKILYANGRVVTENVDETNNEFLENFNVISEEDEETGYIYVLKSKSNKEVINSISNLYKIGYSNIEIPERIKNAEKEVTYLYAPVEFIAGWQCYNMNPQKFEQLLHNFFGKACLNVDVFDGKGRRYTPREWFIAPLDVIRQAVELLITGKIVEYRYDSENEVIEKRKNNKL